jgi:hypothetical protein
VVSSLATLARHHKRMNPTTGDKNKNKNATVV